MAPCGPTSVDTERPRSFSHVKTSSHSKLLLSKGKIREEERNSSESEMISAASDPCLGAAQLDPDMPASENETEFELDFPGYESAHSGGQEAKQQIIDDIQEVEFAARSLSKLPIRNV